eukprot:2274698-Alexandrium_andersonii.AAC.1
MLGSSPTTAGGMSSELSGPCLLGQHGSLPIQRDGGVFWLDVEVSSTTDSEEAQPISAVVAPLVDIGDDGHAYDDDTTLAELA